MCIYSIITITDKRAKDDFIKNKSEIVETHNPLTHCAFWTALLDFMSVTTSVFEL